jgi:NADH:ubiquinone oxidoreductase subunit
VGDLKFGVLKGVDRFGNKYYEDLDLPFGQHRWVEYSNIHDFDATMIQPEWHGWMHHVFDEVPDESTQFEVAPTTLESNAIYHDHVGYTDYKPTEQLNLSQYRFELSLFIDF